MSKFGANIFSIATTSNYLPSSVVGEVNVDYFDFSWKKLKNWCEKDFLQNEHYYIISFFRFSDIYFFTEMINMMQIT